MNKQRSRFLYQSVALSGFLLFAIVPALIYFSAPAYGQFSDWGWVGGGYDPGWMPYIDSSTRSTGGSTGGSTGTGTTSDTSSTGANIEQQTIDWSTYTSAHNYGIDNLSIPDGAVGVVIKNGSFFCLENDEYFSFLLTRESDGTKLLEKGKEVGELTVLDQPIPNKSYVAHYGFFYPWKIVADDFLPSSDCFPSWYVQPAGIAEEVWVWDPNLNISESSVATAETIHCTENYERKIKVVNGTVTDAETGTDLYYQNTATTPNISSFNSSNRKLSYPWTGAVIGRMDDSTGDTGFICVQTQSFLDSLKTAVEDEPDQLDINPVYDIPNFTLPLGAIVIQKYSGTITCMESGEIIESLDAGTDGKILSDNQTQVGEITISNHNESGYDYGYIVPVLLPGGKESVASSCFPSWFLDAELGAAEDSSADATGATDITDEKGWLETVAGATVPKVHFSDVKTGQFYSEPVAYAVYDNWEDKTSEFFPSDERTRADLVEMILRAKHESLLTSFEATFVDVPASHPQAAYIYTGVARGYWKGYADGSKQFGPDDVLLRAHLAVILSNMLGLTANDEDSYNPADNFPSWALPYIRRVHKHGYMKGCGDGVSFCASAELNKAESLTAVFRVFGPQ